MRYQWDEGLALSLRMGLAGRRRDVTLTHVPERASPMPDDPFITWEILFPRLLTHQAQVMV